MSTMTEIITEGDRIRWQLEAASELQQILREAAVHESLPAVQWTVESRLRLHGRVQRFGQWQAPEQRAAFGAWARFLELARQPEERIGRSTSVTLRAEGERGRVAVYLTAALSMHTTSLSSDED